MRLSEFTVESKQLTQEEWYNPTTWFDKSKPAPAGTAAAPAPTAAPTAAQQARLKDMEAGQAKGKTAIDKFNQGDNVGGVMTAASGINDLANAAGMSFLQKLETGWMAIKAGARAAWAGRKGNGDAAIVAAIGSLGGEVSELGVDIVNEPNFAQNFQQAVLAMKDSTDPDQQEMYKKYMSRQLTAESFKAYMIRFNTAIQNMKKNPETAQFNTDDTPYVTPVENPTGPNANPMSQDPAQRAATTETAELNRILKLSGMEFISEDSSKSITVQRGDTLGKIAADNSTTVDALVKLNNIANPDRIYPGDVIKIPSGQGDPGGLAKRQGPTSTPDTDTDPNHPSREERALLNMIARRESNGDYNAINYKAKDSLKKGTMQITGDSGHHPFEGQSGTTAAGRYQMLWNTWKTAAKWAGVDPENFSPGNQDLAALALAKWAYKKKYGGDLSKDIKDPKLLAQVIDGLTPWSVKSGGPGFTTQHYASALSDTQAA